MSLPPLKKIPEAPDYLGAIGLAEWNRIMPVLVRNHLVNELSYHWIGHACRCFEWSFEEPIVTESGNLVYAHPKAMDNYISITEKFGASALANQRIVAKEPVKKRKKDEGGIED